MGLMRPSGKKAGAKGDPEGSPPSRLELGPTMVRKGILPRRRGRNLFYPVLKGLVTAVLLILSIVFVVNLIDSAPVQEQRGNTEKEPDHPSSLVPYVEALLATASVRQGYPKISWERELSGKAHLRRGGGYLFACTQQGEVEALDPRDGSLLWSASLGGWISSPPLFQEGILYTGNANRRLYALEGRSGRILWFFPTEGEIISSPVSCGGMVLFSADNDSVFKLVNRLYVVDGKTGALRWSYETPNWSKSPPAVGGSLIYVAGYGRKLIALSLESGTEIWSFQADNIVVFSPCLLGDTLVACTVDGQVLGLDAATGQARWKAAMPGAVWTDWHPSRRIFLYYDRTGALSAILPDGKVAWTFRKEGLLFSLVRGEDELLLFDNGGRVHVLDPASGRRSAIIHLPFADPVSAEAEGDLLFVSSASGKLVCFNLDQIDWLSP